MRAALLALALALTSAAPTPTTAETLSFSLPKARALSREAFRRGDYKFANALGRELLKANPNDIAALIVITATEPFLGTPKEGVKAGKQAFKLAETRGLRFESAYYTARAQLAAENFNASQLWLRRAFQAASTESQERRAASAFRDVKRLSPWSTRFSFSVAPSSNLNGGSRVPYLLVDDSPYILELSGSAQALSGVRATAQGSLTYALSRTKDHRTAVSVTAYRTFNQLSSEAKDLAPETKGSDFDYGLLEVTLSHRLRAAKGPLPDRYELSFGQTWYGGEALDNILRLSLSRDLQLSKTLSARVTGEVEHRASSSSDFNDRTGQKLQFQIGHRFKSGAQINGALAFTRTTADRARNAYTSQSLSLGYSPAKPVLGARVHASLGVSYRDYPDYSLGFFPVPDGRKEWSVNAGLNLTLENLDLYGFQPVISITARETDSNISRFDSRTFGLSLGFRSAF